MRSPPRAWWCVSVRARARSERASGLRRGRRGGCGDGGVQRAGAPDLVTMAGDHAHTRPALRGQRVPPREDPQQPARVNVGAATRRLRTRFHTFPERYWGSSKKNTKNKNHSRRAPPKRESSTKQLRKFATRAEEFKEHWT